MQVRIAFLNSALLRTLKIIQHSPLYLQSWVSRFPNMWGRRELPKKSGLPESAGRQRARAFSPGRLHALSGFHLHQPWPLAALTWMSVSFTGSRGSKVVAALRLSKRWEMWDMSSPRDPRRTDLYEDKRCRGKSRIRTPGKLHKILEYFLSETSYILSIFIWLFHIFP